MRDVVLVVIAGHVNAAGQHGVIRGLVRIGSAAGADVPVHIVKPALAHEQRAVKERVGLQLLAFGQTQVSQIRRERIYELGLILPLLGIEHKAPCVLAQCGLCVGLLVFVSPYHNAVFNIRHCPVHVEELFGRRDDHGVEGLEIDNDGIAGKVALERFQNGFPVVCFKRRRERTGVRNVHILKHIGACRREHRGKHQQAKEQRDHLFLHSAFSVIQIVVDMIILAVSSRVKSLCP